MVDSCVQLAYTLPLHFNRAPGQFACLLTLRTVSIFRVETVLFSAWGANAAIYTRTAKEVFHLKGGLSRLFKHSDQLCSLFEKIFKWILPRVIDHPAKGFFLSVFFPSNSFSNNLRNPSQTSREWERLTLRKDVSICKILFQESQPAFHSGYTQRQKGSSYLPWRTAAKSTQLILIFSPLFFPFFIFPTITITKTRKANSFLNASNSPRR